VQFEFGNTYKGKIVELQQSGAYVEIHQQMDPVFVRNSQLDIKKVISLFAILLHMLFHFIYPFLYFKF